MMETLWQFFLLLFINRLLCWNDIASAFFLPLPPSRATKSQRRSQSILFVNKPANTDTIIANGERTRNRKSTNKLLGKKKRRITWEESYELLKHFKANHGHCNVPRMYKQDPRLAHWVNQQRTRSEQLPADKKGKLDSIRFAWSLARTWEENYELLKEYKDKHGHCNVPRTYKQDPKLGQWVNNQRHRKNRLPADKIEMLDSIGFSWKITRFWEESYALLKQFKAKHGHCNVPTNFNEDPKLAQWVKSQRDRKDKLPADKREKLDAIGFSWNFLDDAWEENFELLKHYKTDSGDCNVPLDFVTSSGKNLGEWAQYQRMCQGILPKDKFNKLDELGFLWKDVAPIIKEQQWLKMYERLKEYKETYGDCLVPAVWEEDRKLGNWVRVQRKSYNQSRLAEARIAKLEDIGFVWKLRDHEQNNSKNDKKWMDHFEKVVSFKGKNNGDTWIPNNYPPDEFLGRWAERQRILYKKGILREDRRQHLDSIGFQWTYDEEYEKAWMEKYLELQDYIKENSSLSNLSVNKKDLFHWIWKQSIHNAKGSLKAERKKKLELLNIDWSSTSSAFRGLDS